MCILIVEDEVLIAEIMAESLEEAGYDVLTASNGPEALQLIERHPSAFTGLLSDYHLPGGLTGLDVACVFRERFPCVPVVVATGRPDVLEGHRRWRPSYVLLRKPYGPAEIVRLLLSMIRPARGRHA